MTLMGRHGDGGWVRRKDGRIQVALTMMNGRRVYRAIPRMHDQRAQERLAKEALRRLIALREAELDPSSQLLGEYLRSWLASVSSAVNPRMRPNTLSFYRIMAEKHVIPVLGTYRLDRLREHHVQRWLDGLNVSPRYVHHCRAFLRRVLNVALAQRLIDRNPAVYVELPMAPEFLGDPLTPEEAKRLIAATTDDRLGILWRLALMTGLRSGELLGLGWDDIDLERGLIRVETQLSRRDGEWVRTPTKAKRTLGAVSLDPVTRDELAAHQRRQAAERTPDWSYWGLVFTTPHGMPLDRHRVAEAFHAACTKAQVKQRRFHDLRASAATLMAEAGVTEDVRQARLGHSSIAMARHYAPVRETRDRAAVEALARLIG